MYAFVVLAVEVQLERVARAHAFWTRLLPDDEIEDIFVSEYVDEEGVRTYESLWFFC